MKNGYAAAAWVTALGAALAAWLWDPHQPMTPPITEGDWETFRDCGECPEMVVVPAGSFIFGAGAHKHREDRPVFPVTIAKPYAMGRYEVTIAEWAVCVRADVCPDVEHDRQKDKGPEYPRHDVDWFQANLYADWLSDVTGRRYRLPSMTEWEWAARAGTETRWHWGDRASDERANLGINGVIGARPVGRYPPNPFGLYDVSGNVNEWTADCLSFNSDIDIERPRDGRPYQQDGCRKRQIGGEDWWATWDSPGLLSWWGAFIDPATAANGRGFRVLRELD